MVRPIRLLLLPLLLATLPCQEPFQKLDADRSKGAATIQVEDLKAWLARLTSPEFGGRGTGQEGFRRAAEMVRDHFKSLGLEPAGDDGTYWQKVPWTGVSVDKQATSLSFRKDGKEVLRVPAERLSGRASKSLQASGPVTLLTVAPPREGEKLEIAGLDDLDLKDHVVLLYVPGRHDETALVRWQAASKLAGRETAAIVDLEADKVGGGIEGTSGAAPGAGRAQSGRRLVPASVTMGGDDTKALLVALGIEALEPGAVATKLTARLEIVTGEGEAPAFNVAGILRGSDPKLKDEYVVIGSHLDHLGRRGSSYYPGADDDGSGSTGVLAISRAFAVNPVRPRRSILFVTFCGEENGLLGSAWFVDHCPISLGAIASELQMDMIGRNEETQRKKAQDSLNAVDLIGTQRISRDLHALCLKKNETAGFELRWDQESVFSRSDHANFARKGIPIAFFFTGFHPDYHRMTDTPDKIDYPKLQRVVTWVYDIAFELAEQQARPLVDPDLWEKNRGEVHGVATPVAPMRPAPAAK